jgi:hypothetical protein
MQIEKRCHVRFKGGTDAKFRPVLFFPVDFADAGMRGGGRALSDG